MMGHSALRETWNRLRSGVLGWASEEEVRVVKKVSKSGMRKGRSMAVSGWSKVHWRGGCGIVGKRGGKAALMFLGTSRRVGMEGGGGEGGIEPYDVSGGAPPFHRRYQLRG